MPSKTKIFVKAAIAAMKEVEVLKKRRKELDKQISKIIKKHPVLIVRLDPSIDIRVK